MQLVRIKKYIQPKIIAWK